jgi:archaeosine-15-forming tRNA-guanine transglycosylase
MFNLNQTTMKTQEVSIKHHKDVKYGIIVRRKDNGKVYFFVKDGVLSEKAEDALIFDNRITANLVAVIVKEAAEEAMRENPKVPAAEVGLCEFEVTVEERIPLYLN